MRINWKKVASFGLEIGKQLFPVLNLVELFAGFKGMSSKEKQNLAFQSLKDGFIQKLLPGQAKKVTDDPRFESLLRRLIDDGVEINNFIAEKLSEE